MVGHDVVIVAELFVADRALSALIYNFLVQQLGASRPGTLIPDTPAGDADLQRAALQSHQSALFPDRFRPQQKRDRWIGQYSFRRSLIGYLLWQRANLRQMGSRNGHSPLLQFSWGRFQTDTKGNLAEFLCCLLLDAIPRAATSERERNVQGVMHRAV